MGLKKNIKAITRNIKKYRKSSFFRAKFIFTKYYDQGIIRENDILIQCYSGTGISCNPFYILERLCTMPQYSGMNIYVAVNNQVYDEIKDYMLACKYDVTVVKMHSKKYCKVLAQSKYLINNVTFPTYFIKNEKQIYLNTWHGTPLKALGKAMTEEMHTIGNVQRNFLMSDYILAPNQFTLDIIRRDYMLDNLYKGSYLLCGYPRNHIFYDIDRQKQIRNKLELDDKKIIVYMPTWRGSHAVRKDQDQYIYIMHMLLEMEKNISDDTLVFVKEHNMSTFKIDFSGFEKIRAFPENMETYEFLCIADCLITDYSSVMFDFANTGRKIILYAYDQKEYLKDRGMYMDFDQLPFTIVYTTLDLINEVNNLDYTSDYRENIFPLIKYDQKNTIDNILNLMITGQNEKLQVISGDVYNNHKENVLIFTGSLLRNGITTALKGVLNNVDKEERNYILTFTRRAVAPNRHTIPELGDFQFISVMGQKNFRLSEVLPYFLYFRLNICNKYIEKKLKSIFSRESRRIYPNIQFKYLIHYTGYERQYMNLFRFMDGIRIVYVHNNLMEEYKNRGNIHLPTVRACYKEFEEIVIIRESMKKELIGKFDNMSEKVHIAHNFNNYDDIIIKSNSSIAFDENTESNIELDKLEQILYDKENTVFINIARFSVEKGLDNLVSAFNSYYLEGNTKSYLIIIGGHGKSYLELLDQVNSCQARENIIIIKSLSNPYPILKCSDVFILSSHYEGLPMVIMEALILKKPVISTNITGPREFLEQGYGFLVEDSVDGLIKGMEAFKKNGLSFLKTFDYVEFNKIANEEFRGLFYDGSEY